MDFSRTIRVLCFAASTYCLLSHIAPIACFTNFSSYTYVIFFFLGSLAFVVVLGALNLSLLGVESRLWRERIVRVMVLVVYITLLTTPANFVRLFKVLHGLQIQLWIAQYLAADLSLNCGAQKHA